MAFLLIPGEISGASEINITLLGCCTIVYKGVCADPMVIEFPRDARARTIGVAAPQRFACLVAFRSFGESAGRIVAGYSFASCSIIVNTSSSTTHSSCVCHRAVPHALRLAAAYRCHVRSLQQEQQQQWALLV